MNEVNNMEVTLVSYTQEPKFACALAAANCYNSKPIESIVDACYESGHTSVLEFAQFHFHVEGVSRALLAQLTRHRHAGYAVRSQRYVNENGFEYVIPPSIKRNSTALGQFNTLMANIDSCYQHLLEIGVPAEDARYVLPNACCTTLNVTMNLRALINFMNLRLCTRAQWEIRELAQKMRDLILEIEPKLESMLVPKCESNPDAYFCTENKCCGKHKPLKEIAKG